MAVFMKMYESFKADEEMCTKWG